MKLIVNEDEWKSRAFFLQEHWKLEMLPGWEQGACLNDEKAVVVTCSDEGIQAAQRMRIPAVAIRNHDYDKERGNQSLFGTPILLEHLEDLDSGILECLWNRFYGIPLVIGNTRRCRIREMCEEDIPFLSAVSAGLIEEGGADFFLDKDEYSEFWRSYIKNQYAFYDYGLWMVEEKTAEQGMHPVGIAGFTDRKEMGYWISPAFRREGYATEVCHFLMEYADDRFGWECICLRIKSNNLPSRRFAMSLGFCQDEKYERDSRQIERWVYYVDEERAQQDITLFL